MTIGLLNDNFQESYSKTKQNKYLKKQTKKLMNIHQIKLNIYL